MRKIGVMVYHIRYDSYNNACDSPMDCTGGAFLAPVINLRCLKTTLKNALIDILKQVTRLREYLIDYHGVTLPSPPPQQQ